MTTISIAIIMLIPFTNYPDKKFDLQPDKPTFVCDGFRLF